MFDRIAHRYDLLNRLLSFGRDVAWRKQIAKNLPHDQDLKILDLATGTADVLLALNQQVPRMGNSVGLDMSGGMLHFGHQKIRNRGLDQKLRLVRGDATCIGLASAQFNATTISFGIRNVINVSQGLEEMHRILQPGGRALILEFSLPPNKLFRHLYLFYFRHILPLLGGIISGDNTAYKYLNQTVETFPYGQEFCDLMIAAGFKNVTPKPLTLGIATLYVGDK